MNYNIITIDHSFYHCIKKGAGDYYKNSRGISIKIQYKVYLCDESCGVHECESCIQHARKQPIQEGMENIVLGEGLLFDYIEETLLNDDIRRASYLLFVLCSKDAFEDIGALPLVPPNNPICIYIEEPAI